MFLVWFFIRSIYYYLWVAIKIADAFHWHSSAGWFFHILFIIAFEKKLWRNLWPMNHKWSSIKLIQPEMFIKKLINLFILRWSNVSGFECLLRILVWKLSQYYYICCALYRRTYGYLGFLYTCTYLTKGFRWSKKGIIQNLFTIAANVQYVRVTATLEWISPNIEKKVQLESKIERYFIECCLF